MGKIQTLKLRIKKGGYKNGKIRPSVGWILVNTAFL